MEARDMLFGWWCWHPIFWINDCCPEIDRYPLIRGLTTHMASLNMTTRGVQRITPISTDDEMNYISPPRTVS